MSKRAKEFHACMRRYLGKGSVAPNTKKTKGPLETQLDEAIAARYEKESQEHDELVNKQGVIE